MIKFWVLATIALLGTALAPAQRAYDVRSEIRFDQRLDEQLPLDAEFTNEDGKKIKLGDLFGERPVVLLFAFYRCQGVCAMEFTGVLEAMNGMNAFHAGLDYDLINISIHPKETHELGRAKKRDFVEIYRRPGGQEGIHMLVGDEKNILRVTDTAGFKFHFDREKDLIDHPSGIVIATPDGRISRYIFGVSYPSKMVRDALITASANKIGQKVEQPSLFVCWQYDPETGQYRLIVKNALIVGGLLTVLILGLSIGVMSWRGSRHRPTPGHRHDKGEA